MSIVRYQPRQGRPAFLDTFFDDFFTRDRFLSDLTEGRRVTPAANIAEAKEAYRVELAVPGFRKGDFSIELNDGVLHISGDHQQELNEDTTEYSLREFTGTQFSRSFNLPDTIDEEKIEANYENGILTIVLPKKEEAQPRSRTIRVR